MVTPRKCHASAVLDNKLYVLGGSDQQLSVLSAEVLDLSLPESQWSWRPLANLPSWHNGSVAPVIRDTLYLPVAYGMDTDKTFHPGSELWLGWEGEEGHGRKSRDRPGVGVLGDKIFMVVRDNAANMKAAFQDAGFDSFGCLAHSFQVRTTGASISNGKK